MNKLKRIIIFLLIFMNINLIFQTVNAFSVSTDINSNIIEVGEKIEYTILFDEKILTSDLKISYDNEKIKYVGTETDKVDFNISDENNYLHIVYVDESGVGNTKIKLVFKAIKSFESSEIKILEINAHTCENRKSYSIEDEKILQNSTKQTVIAREIINKEEDKNNKDENVEDGSSPTILPQAGTKEIVWGIAFVVLTVVIIFLGYKNIKFRKMFCILIFICVVSKIVDVKAVSSGFIGIYDRIYGCQKVVTVVLNKDSKNISFSNIEDYLDKNLKIEKILKSNNEEKSYNSNICTGDRIVLNNGDSYQIIVYGDINGDGKINSNDIANIIEDKLNLKKITGIYRKASNLSNVNDKSDLNLNSDDIKKIKDYILNRLEGNFVDILPEELKITGISIKEVPNKTSYIKGESLDLSGGVITVKYEDETTSNIVMDASNVRISGYDAKKIGEQKIKVTYGKYTAIFNVKVHNEITGISIKEVPNKTSYIKGENLDLSGGIITVKYEDKTTSNMAMDASNVGISGYDANKIGEQEIKVTYGKYTATFNVKVHNEITGISIKEVPNKTSYIKGENLDLSGGIITVKYEDKTTSNMAMDASNVGISGYDANKIGEQEIKVTYGKYIAIFNVKVHNEMTGISIKEVPNKTSYIKGENLDLSGGIITVKYEDKTTSNIVMDDSNIGISGYDANKIGEQEIKVTYGKYTDTFNVKVHNEMTGISVKKVPNKTSYIKGENLDLSGGIVTVKYEDKTTSDIEMKTSNVGISGYDANKIGEQEIKVTYGKYTAIFNVKVHNEMTGISVKKVPNKTSYIKGENLDLSGGIITVKYEDKTTSDIEMKTSNVGISGYDANKIGEQEIKVTYGKYTTTFKVIVNDYLSSIVVTKSPNKIKYNYGEELDLSGMVITAIYASGKTEIVDKYIISGYNKTKLGEQVINVNYAEKETTFTITLYDYLKNIQLTGNLDKVSYLQNEYLDLKGMVVTAIYASGNTRNVTANKNLIVSTDILELNNNIDNLTILGKQTINIEYSETSETNKKVNVSIDEKEKPEIEVSVDTRKVTSSENYKINSNNANDYKIEHYTKKYISQGSCRYIYNNVNYIMCARMNGNDEDKTSLYILNDNKEVLWVIDDRSYGHANSMTWNNNESSNYIYILNTSSENVSIDRIDVNMMMKKVINKDIGTIIETESFSDEFVKSYVRLDTSSDIANNIAYDKITGKLYAAKCATKLSDNKNFRLSEIKLNEEDSTFMTYENTTNNVEQGLVGSLTGYVKFTDKGTNAGLCMSENYVFFGRYISENGTVGDDEFLKSHFPTGRKNYIDVFKRAKHNNIYVYTYIGTYIIENDLIMSSNDVVGELESLVFVNQNNNTIILEALINTQGDYEKYLRIKLTDLI